MKILAIETSCDETAAAVVEDARTVLSSVVSSQAELHAKTGGVVPEVAARQHVPAMIPVVEEALEKAGMKLEDVDAIAVAECPGLLSALLVGSVSAQFLAGIAGKPLIPVNHIAGHLYSVYLESEIELKFPRLLLTVSGGHNEIILMRDHFDFEVLGETVDDSAGEAFDKAARLMGLGYPGGPAIEKRAREGKKGSFKLPRPMINDDSLNMSFSGLKTAIYYEMQKIEPSPENVSDLAYEFQEAVVDVLSKKVARAVEKNPDIKEIHLVGGVSANKTLRKKLDEVAKEASCPIYYPNSLKYCTDNAAMIGAAAYFQHKKWPDRYSPATKLNISSSTHIVEYYS